MSRILITENATVKRELVSPSTVINWDPITNGGVLTFQMQELIYLNGEFLKSVPVSSITIRLEDLISKNYEVEVEPGVNMTVPGGLIMLAFKKAFEESVIENNLGYPD